MSQEQPWYMSERMARRQFMQRTAIAGGALAALGLAGTVAACGEDVSNDGDGSSVPWDSSLQVNPYEGLAVKEDGSPYRVAFLPLFLAVDFMVNAEKYMSSLVKRSGAEYIMFNADQDAKRQIDQIDNLLSLEQADGVILQSVDQKLLVPAVEKLQAAGIPVIAFDTPVDTDTDSFVQHDFGGDAGTNQLGEFVSNYATENDAELKLLEIWGIRGTENSEVRHEGFRTGLDDNPLVTVVESSDSDYLDDKAQRLVEDAFNTDPDLNALFIQAGGTAGVLSGLAAVGRTAVAGEDGHVLTVTNDIDSSVVDGIRSGTVDACGSHGPVDLVDIAYKLLLQKMVLKESVKKSVTPPMVAITNENLETERVFGVTPAWPLMPSGDWDEWPVLDTTSIGIETPTVELRKAAVGY